MNAVSGTCMSKRRLELSVDSVELEAARSHPIHTSDRQWLLR